MKTDNPHSPLISIKISPELPIENRRNPMVGSIYLTHLYQSSPSRHVQINGVERAVRVSGKVPILEYRGTSLIRKHPPPLDPPRTLGHRPMIGS